MINPIRDDIRALAAYAVAPSQGMVKLDAMENPYRLPDEVRTELAAAFSSLELNRYPDPDPEPLKQALRRTMGIPDQAAILLGNGSDELIQMLAMATARPGATLVSVEPAFVMFRLIARFTGLNYVGIPLAPDFSLPLAELLDAIAVHQPALVFIAYPNNPTGNCFAESDLWQVIDAAPGLVVIDEAYFPFTDRSLMPALLSRPNLLVMRTLSKLGLAGIRLGFLSGPADVIREIDKVRLPYNISVLDQAAARLLLERQELLAGQARILREDRQKLALRLGSLPGIEVFPSEANFLLFRVANAPSVFDGLLRRGILIKNLCTAHPLLTDCLRVTVGTMEENDQFLDALEEALRQP